MFLDVDSKRETYSVRYIPLQLRVNMVYSDVNFKN